MAIQAVPRPTTHIGPAADRAAFVGNAAVGDFFFEDDTGIIYRKSVAGAWIAQAAGAGSVPVAAAENIANPTAPQVLAHLMNFDGTTWDRVGAPNLFNDGFAPNDVSSSLPVRAILAGYNGSTFDRLRTRGTGILQVEPAYSFLNVVAGQATTVVKSGPGTLHSITFWGPPTALATFNAYDNTAASGTLIAGPILAAGVVVATTFLIDAAFATGLTIITATANWAGYTVTYR